MHVTVNEKCYDFDSPSKPRFCHYQGTCSTVTSAGKKEVSKLMGLNHTWSQGQNALSEDILLCLSHLLVLLI